MGIPSSGIGPPPSPNAFSSEGSGWGLTQLGKEQVKDASIKIFMKLLSLRNSKTMNS